MCGEIYGENQKKQADRDVNGSGAPGAMKESIPESEIQIFCRVGEARGDEQNHCDHRLQRPAAAVISDAMQGPEKKRRHHKMKKGKQAHTEREARVEEIFRAADQVMPEEISPGSVKRPGDINQQRRDCLARYQQHIAAPEADARQNDGDIAEVQKICRAPGVPINGEPDQEPDKGAPSKPPGDILPGWRRQGHWIEGLCESGGMVSNGDGKSHRWI
jgi:hypothetical protein